MKKRCNDTDADCTRPNLRNVLCYRALGITNERRNDVGVEHIQYRHNSTFSAYGRLPPISGNLSFVPKGYKSARTSSRFFFPNRFNDQPFTIPTDHHAVFGNFIVSRDAPLAKREAGASELLRDRGAGRAVAGLVGTVFFEQPNSAYAEFGWLPRAVLFLQHGFPPLSSRLVCLADRSPENPGQFADCATRKSLSAS